ncbi:diacylglycerol lipase-alpha-like isoform X2 [Anopheles albimanus]|uniref:diacylglycerol lipase-alpha-like isoform X2 n=1 Tax=Anopheles albimanus TaxID=7167 RepID=UPI00164041C7|nr:diacylglycerol lipase-alpha-like isoform X2 [Anopheles albimanus]
MMPGIVAFRRRWSVGSDDLVVPGLFLLVIHFIWLLVLLVVTLSFHFDQSSECQRQLWHLQIGYMVLLAVCMAMECAICVISMRGSILDTERRTSMQYLLYGRLLLMLLEIGALTLGIIWLRDNYVGCPTAEPKEVMLAAVTCNLFVVFSMVATIWCTFDPAGRSWVKMKKYQRSMRESESRFNYKRSGSRSRNWRQRKVIRAYQDSWDHRCRLLFCCMGNSDRSRNSFTDIARLLSDFFRDLDVVPSDVVAGLVLLRKFQKLEREVIVRQQKNGTHKFLSGVPITASTKFLALNAVTDYEHFQSVIRYMYFAQGAYGWPMYLMSHSSTGVCQLASELRYCCCRRNTVDVVDDNCCFCNYAALKKMLEVGEVEVIYATYHVDIGETPFFVAIDYNCSKIVVSIRGTLSMKDVLTDLNAEGEPLPLNPPREDWLGHKGMVQAALYIKRKLEEENLIQRALAHNADRGTQHFGLVLVGHSLGAGTAAILAILLKQEYEVLHCYSYSPPGGLLSMPAVEYSKSFITSVVVGKDVVPRIGLYQMEALRADLINAIQRSIDPKWKTIACSVICCCCGPEPTSVMMMSTKDSNVQRYKQDRNSARQSTVHPNDNSIALTLHHPLYPPGRIIHIVRHHPVQEDQILKKREPVYQAIWADNADFDEVLISPVMIQDHMPDKVLAALEKVVASAGPQKPHRQFASAAGVSSPEARGSLIAAGEPSTVSEYPQPNVASPVVSHKICLETSFTNMQLLQLQRGAPLPPAHGQQHGSISQASSTITESVLGVRSVQSSLVDDSGIPQSISGPSEVTTVILAEVQSGAAPELATSVRVASATTGDGGSSNSSSGGGGGGSGTALRTLNFIASANPTRNDMYLKFPPKTAPPIPPHSRSENLSLGIARRNSYEVQKVDLIHDDWFGMAPLASPESLSELSSISSRASMFTGLLVGAGTNDKCLEQQQEQQQQQQHRESNRGIISEVADAESQLHTPKVLRRTPKVSGNLSTCAEDARTVNQYKRMGKIFVLNQASSDSSTTLENSEAEADGSRGMFDENSGLLATITERDLAGVSVAAAAASVAATATGATSQTASPLARGVCQPVGKPCVSSCPSCPCRSQPEGSCCQRFNHRECYNFKYTSFNVFKFNKLNECSDGKGPRLTAVAGAAMTPTVSPSAYEDNNNAYTATTTVSPGRACTIKVGLLESHFPVHFAGPTTPSSSTRSTGAGSGQGPLIPIRIVGAPDAGAGTGSRGGNPVVERRTNDTLPLLVNLAEHSSPGACVAAFGRKKNSIHPTDQKPLAVGGFSTDSAYVGAGLGGGGGTGADNGAALTPKHMQATLAQNESNV